MPLIFIAIIFILGLVVGGATNPEFVFNETMFSNQKYIDNLGNRWRFNSNLLFVKIYEI